VKINSTLYLVLALATGLMSCRADQQVSEEQLLRENYTSSLDRQDKQFFLYLPKGYTDQTKKQWPVILFLHGDGERGNGLDELGYTLAHGPLYEAWVQRRDLPFIIVAPQLPLFGRDTLGISYLTGRDIDKFPQRLTTGVPPRSTTSGIRTPMTGALAHEFSEEDPHLLPHGWEMVEEDVMTILTKVLDNYHADSDRVYLTGLSYGGFGTWYIASKYPDKFAAISPIVGWGHPDLMEPIARQLLPVWAFSGGRDYGVQTKYFYAGLNKLAELGHTEVRYTIHEDMGHDVWKRVYAGQDIYDWFLQHSL
jgi:predicted peptidase